MSNYTNTFGGAAHDTAEDTIQGVDFDTQFDAVATMSASKANKKVPATTNNLATLDSSGDLGDSLESVTTMKSYAKRGAIYLDAATTSSTISFSGTTISRTAGTIDLSVFKKGDVITITGTTLNNTSYTLASDGATASITTTASTTAESGQVPVFTTEGVVEVLDEDDMATDSASSVPSQQSVKAYVDGLTPTDVTAVATTSGSAVPLATGISGATEITLTFDSVSLDGGTDDICIQLGYGATPTYITTGYVCRYGNSSGHAAGTVGMVVSYNSLAGDAYCGHVHLTHMGSNKWVYSSVLQSQLSTQGADWAGGYLDMSANELTAIRVSRDGSTDSFDAGQIRVIWR